MDIVGLEELRHDALELVRRVEAGEEIIITVSGRPSARLIAATSARWRTWEEIKELFPGSMDPDWEGDQNLIDRDLRDPSAPR